MPDGGSSTTLEPAALCISCAAQACSGRISGTGRLTHLIGQLARTRWLLLPRQLRFGGFNLQPLFCRCRLHAPSIVHSPLQAVDQCRHSSVPKRRASLPVKLHSSAASHSLHPTTAAGIDWTAAESASCETRGPGSRRRSPAAVPFATELHPSTPAWYRCPGCA